MRLLVISDTHGYLEAAKKVIRERGPWEHVVHLGDSALDAVSLAADLGIDVIALRGNNEYPDSPAFEDALMFTAGGASFYALHGHELDLNPWDRDLEEKLAELASRARQAGARAALFGHTHQPLVRELAGVLIINPGGLGLGDQRKTYAELVVDAAGEVRAEIKEA